MTHKDLDLFHEFFASGRHLLEKGDKQWPTDRILFQLGYEHAEDSPITEQAEQYLKDGRVNWSWLKQLNRKEKYEKNPNYMTLAHPGNIDHDGEYDFVVEMVDRETAVSQRNRIWDLNTGESRKISEEEYKNLTINDNYDCEEEFNSVHKLYIKLDHNRVEVFQQGSNNYRSYSNHRDECALIYLDKDRFLTYSPDYTIRLWSVNLIEWGIEIPNYNNFRLPIPAEKIYDLETDSFLGFQLISDHKAISVGYDSYQMWNLSDLSYKDFSFADQFAKYNLNDGEEDPIEKFFHNDHYSVLQGVNGGEYFILNEGELIQFKGHQHFTDQFKFLEGKRFSTSGPDGTFIWESPLIQIAWDSNNYFIRSQFDDDRLICLDKNDASKLIIWNISNNQKELHDLVPKHKNKIPTVFPVGKYELLVSNWKSPLIHWDLQTNNKIPVSDKEIYVGFRPIDGTYLLGVDKPKGTIYIYNNEQHSVSELKAHEEGITAVKVLDNNTIISGSWDNIIHWWDYKNNMTRTFLGHSLGIKGLEQLNEFYFISWGNDETIRLWSLDQSDNLSTYYFEGVDKVFIISTVRILCFSSTGEFVFLEIQYNKLKQAANG